MENAKEEGTNTQKRERERGAETAEARETERGQVYETLFGEMTTFTGEPASLLKRCLAKRQRCTVKDHIRMPDGTCFLQLQTQGDSGNLAVRVWIKLHVPPYIKLQVPP